MTAAGVILLAWGVELLLGWPDWLFKRVKHPVVWLGALISWLEKALNKSDWSHPTRYIAGMLTTLICVGIVTAFAWGVSHLLPSTWWGILLEALIASSLIASRSLYAHVAAVYRPLAKQDLDKARSAVSQIVGRDPSQLDEGGIARASLESLAENASDGVIAPVLWGIFFGLPGLAAYKAINTLDSMIGHRNERYGAFGGFAARLDDIANFIPARLTGVLLCVASGKRRAITIVARDAGQHRSPNAGWPEAAMAGGLGVRLSGPRAYGIGVSQEPWLNGSAREPVANDIKRGLDLYRRAMLVAALNLAVLALIVVS
ncbi:MAG: adenosylcobinamide-phosphate synthase CbiB [Henriciella sp.]